MDRWQWQPLGLLHEQLNANLEGLATRDPELARRLAEVAPAQPYFVAAAQQQVALGTERAGGIAPLPNPLPPAAAKQVAVKLFPAGQCTEPVLVAGLDQGWLWNALYRLEVGTPRTPGHRPPLYFLAESLERLWTALHLHDWRDLLADERARIFAGADCVQQLQASMIEDTLAPWPRLSVTVDPTVWPAGAGLDSLISVAHQTASARHNALLRQLHAIDASVDTRELARRIRAGDRLRVLGITSRFTTFLQYSMRDWLAACEQLGHETLLLIEQADHQIANPRHFAEVSARFRPDLILMIDHYRGEFTGLPQNVPCVMWVQDRLPNIFRPQAGAAQEPMDFVLGYGRQECIVAHGYPGHRFMPATVGVNQSRFVSRRVDERALNPFACDVSFVSHASTPPDLLVQQEIDKMPLPEGKRLLADVLERLRAIYQDGGFVTELGQIRGIVRESAWARGLDTSDLGGLIDFFVQKVNNALFRQQAIAWVAEMDLDLHLYGRGWEHHPHFSRFARGVADNQNQLASIYQASTINLQVTPFGAVHQRLFDGLSAGGFFLLRHCTGDECDLLYRQMWQWCERAGIRGGGQFFAHAPAEVQDALRRIVELTGEDPSKIPDTFFLGLEEMAAAGFTRSPATLFGEPEYGRVTFRTREDLQAKVRYFLASAEERRQIAGSMRARVLEHMTYTGITRRLLAFIGQNLAEAATLHAAAA